MPDIASDYNLPESLKGTVLENILRARVYEILGAKQKLPAMVLEGVLEKAAEIRPFRKALRSKSPAVIAEIKKASPSAGLIRKDPDFLKIAREYREAGAAALSILTEVRYFQGGLEILASLRWNNSLPLLRKDFIIDRYQILEARHAGADAVLLIAALLDAAALKMLRTEAEKCGMEALVEVHNEAELEMALESGATLVGVNNRDLRTFEVSLDVSLNLAKKMPKQVLPVAESGIRNAGDLRRLFDAGYRGFLVGEHLMRAPSPGAALRELLRGR
jgi:indole-3-glycerol phosphate synthase